MPAEKDELDYPRVSCMPNSAFPSFIHLYTSVQSHSAGYKGADKHLMEKFCFGAFNLLADIRTNYKTLKRAFYCMLLEKICFAVKV